VIVLVLTAVPAGLRGDLTRWLTELAPGVFAGEVSRRVREHLWTRVRLGIRSGSALMLVASSAREQGYEVLTAGKDRWVPTDFEGLTLMVRRSAR
jgi:CRISPR-associated protein Cas2